MQTYRQRERQANIHTDIQTNKHVDRKTGRQTCRHTQTDRCTGRDRHRYQRDIVIQSDTKKERHANKPYKQNRQADRQTDKQRDKHVDIHRQKWLLYGLQDGDGFISNPYNGYYERQQLL